MRVARKTAVLPVNGTVIDHVVFDGNRANRNVTTDMCGAGRGRNVIMIDGNRAVIRSSFFLNAACGTAFALALIDSSYLTVVDNVFADNGSHDITGTWADGLTIGIVRSSVIDANFFYNNSDVSLILGGASNTSIRGNSFVQTYQGAFAGLMFTNWSVLSAQDQQQWADFRGAAVEYNTIDCDARCDIAIQLGALTWAGSSPIDRLRAIGGVIAHNTISTRKQGINVAGAGSPDYPTIIFGNTYVRPNGELLPAGYATQHPSSDLNIQNPGGDSFVDLAGDMITPTTYDWGRAF